MYKVFPKGYDPNVAAGLPSKFEKEILGIKLDTPLSDTKQSNHFNALLRVAYLIARDKGLALPK